jgi:hypothetical protein
MISIICHPLTDDVRRQLMMKVESKMSENHEVNELNQLNQKNERNEKNEMNFTQLS